MSQEDIAAREKLEREIQALNKQRPKKYPTARTMTEEGPEPLPSYFLHRGDPGSKGSLLEPGVLTVAADGKVSFGPPPPAAQTSWRRTAFANWIASPDNPLTARVMVNRIWQHHFGDGIAPTPSNFGKTGLPPSHPELLDWLATEFVQNGWSVKHMHRLMLNSRAYQMASDDIAANLKTDPGNQFFWRMPRQRLEAEILRDQILAVAGTLDPETAGPAVRPYINPDLFQSSTDQPRRRRRACLGRRTLPTTRTAGLASARPASRSLAAARTGTREATSESSSAARSPTASTVRSEPNACASPTRPLCDRWRSSGARAPMRRSQQRSA
jgi:hypothetical protein